jgi:hypothetical protein
VIRSAITGQPAMPMVFAVPKGKPSLLTSSRVTALRIARALGPKSDRTVFEEVTSTSCAFIPLGMFRAMWSKSWVAKPVPVTM